MMAGRPQFSSWNIKFTIKSLLRKQKFSKKREYKKKITLFTSKYADIVMKICSPCEVTLFNSGELCKELSQAASNLNMTLSSPSVSKYSPGKSPKDNTELSLSSSSSDSGVFLILPTTNSRTSFHLISAAWSWTIVIRILRWIPYKIEVKHIF